MSRHSIILKRRLIQPTAATAELIDEATMMDSLELTTIERGAWLLNGLLPSHDDPTDVDVDDPMEEE
jgi:hypothetical protein